MSPHDDLARVCRWAVYAFSVAMVLVLMSAGGVV